MSSDDLDLDPSVSLAQLRALEQQRLPDERAIVADLIGEILNDDPEADDESRIDIDALVHDADDQRWLCRALGMDERCVLD